MRRIFLTLATTAALSAPAWAMDAMSADKMSCADYSAMDSAGQMKAVGMMQADHMQAGGSMSASGKMATGDEAMMQAKSACAAHPDMMVGDAMKASKM